MQECNNNPTQLRNTSNCADAFKGNQVAHSKNKIDTSGLCFDK